MFEFSRYYQARSIPDAIAALARDPDAVVIAGGSDVLIKVREGKLAGRPLVSIHGIAALAGVSMDADGTIVIGSGCTFAEVTNHPLIQAHMPALGEAVDQAGGPQLRNVGTIGGNVCNGATSADSAATLLTLNAELVIEGPDGRRTAALESFYAGPGRVRLTHGELLTAIRVRKADYDGFGGFYCKYAQRNAMDIATLGCAAHVRLEGDRRTVSDCRLAFGVAAPTPVRCHKAEQTAIGQPVSEALLDALGPAALLELAPRSSWRASKAFREQLIRELTRRVMWRAIERAGGSRP